MSVSGCICVADETTVEEGLTFEQFQKLVHTRPIILECFAAPDETFEVVVMTNHLRTSTDVTDTKQVLAVTRSTTVGELKLQLEAKTQVPSSAQRLLHKQDCLEEDAQALREYGVQPGSVINLTPRDEGGEGTQPEPEPEPEPVAGGAGGGGAVVDERLSSRSPHYDEAAALDTALAVSAKRAAAKKAAAAEGAALAAEQQPGPAPAPETETETETETQAESMPIGVREDSPGSE